MQYLLAQSEMEGWGKLLVPAVVVVVWLLSAAGKYIEQKKQEQEARRRQGTRDQVSRLPDDQRAQIPIPPPLQAPADPTITPADVAREQKRRAEMDAARQWALEQKRKAQSAFDQPVTPASPSNTIRKAPPGTPLPQQTRVGPKPPRLPKQRTPTKQQPRTSPLEPRATGPVVTKELPAGFRSESIDNEAVRLPDASGPTRGPRAARTARTAREVDDSPSDSTALSLTAAAQRQTRQRGITAEQLRGSLNPATLRGAFLLAEVLGKPVSLRDAESANRLGAIGQPRL
jgi:hypothetical protein